MKPQKKKIKKKTKFEKVRKLVLLIYSDELEFLDVIIRFLLYSFILTFFQALHCMNTLICIEIL